MRRGWLVLKPRAAHTDLCGHRVQFSQVNGIGQHVAAIDSAPANLPAPRFELVNVDCHGRTSCVTKQFWLFPIEYILPSTRITHSLIHDVPSMNFDIRK